MAKKQHSFWEDAYDQVVVIAKESDKLNTLLQKNGQDELAELLFSIFTAQAQAVKLAMPQDVRTIISDRLEAEMQAEFKAALDEFVAGLQADLGADVDLAHEVE